MGPNDANGITNSADTMIIIPRHTLGAGYYVLTSAVRVSYRSSVVRPSVHTSFPFDNLGSYQRISFKFRVYICIKNISLGIIYVQILIIYDSYGT